MFKNLTKFGIKRTKTEALGFYIAYILLGILLGAVAGGLSGVLLDKGGTFETIFVASAKGGIIVAVLYPPIITFMVIKQKGLLNNFAYIILAVLTGILGFFGGSILGLIPAAFLTTKDNK